MRVYPKTIRIIEMNKMNPIHPSEEMYTNIKLIYISIYNYFVFLLGDRIHS